MKYNIKIMGKEECTIFSSRDLKESCVVISINDTDCNTVIYRNNKILDKLKLWFDDIDRPIPKYQVMLSSDAIKIKDFIDDYKDKTNNIIVHCTAGISRSGAVGCVLARYLNGDDNYLLSTGKYIPNKHVYKTMCEVFELQYSEDLFKKKLEISNKDSQNNLNSSEHYKLSFDGILCDVTIQEN